MQMFDTSPMPFEAIESVLALAIATLLIPRVVLGLFTRRPVAWTRSRYALEVFFWSTAVLLACFGAADFLRSRMEVVDRSLLASLSIVSALVVLAVALVGLAAHLGEPHLPKNVLKIVRGGYLAALFGMALWFAERSNHPFDVMEELPEEATNLLQESPEYLAITDLGAQIPLYQIDLRNHSEGSRMFVANNTVTPDGAKVIPRAEANINANCHGWVFTGGMHLLKGRGVDTILADNGYEVQGTPEAGDIIVYRSDLNEVLHTGIVSGILLDGTCIIESKWGIAGRYLHQAEDQPYGLNYAYYRSQRSGHLVTIIRRSEVDAFVSAAGSSEVADENVAGEVVGEIENGSALPIEASSPTVIGE